jgi:hypothetical protein
MPTLHFFPRCFCLTCNKPVDSLERTATKTDRTLTAVCHGERVNVDFQAEPDVEVRVFDAPRSDAPVKAVKAVKRRKAKARRD